MKTIATAAVLMMLSAPSLAEEPESNEPANTDEPIVLSEAEMDGVTAGSDSLSRYTFGIERTWFDAEPLPRDRFIFNYEYFNNAVYDIQ